MLSTFEFEGVFWNLGSHSRSGYLDSIVSTVVCSPSSGQVSEVRPEPCNKGADVGSVDLKRVQSTVDGLMD